MKNNIIYKLLVTTYLLLSVASAEEISTDGSQFVTNDTERLERLLKKNPIVTDDQSQKGDFPISFKQAVKLAKKHADRVVTKMTKSNGWEPSAVKTGKIIGGSLDRLDSQGKFSWTVKVELKVNEKYDGDVNLPIYIRIHVYMEGSCFPFLSDL